MVAVKVELAQPPSMIEKQVKKSAKKEGAEGPVKDSSPSQPAQSIEGKCGTHCHYNSWLHVAICLLSCALIQRDFVSFISISVLLYFFHSSRVEHPQFHCICAVTVRGCCICTQTLCLRTPPQWA